MATQVQFRGGTTSEHSTFTGVAREVTVDTTKKTVVVHDGSTAGGIPLAKESAVTSAAAITGGSINGTTVGASTASTGRFTTVTATGLTSGRVTYAGASGLLSDSANLTYNGTALTASASSAISAVFNRNTSSGATVDIQVVGGSVGTLGSDTGGNGFLDIAAVNSMYLRSTGASSIMAFSTNNTEKVRITSAGNVGIGTSSPAFTLDVNGDAKVTNAVRYYVGATQYGISFANAGAVGTEAYQGTYIYWGTGSSTSATERMRITNAGNVGIGTTSPNSKLTVSGGQTRIISSTAFVANPLDNGSWSGAITVNTNDGSGDLSGLGMYVNSSYGAGCGIFAKQTSSTTADLTFFTGSGVGASNRERMRIDSSGNVGIGNTNPGSFDGSANRLVVGDGSANQGISIYGSSTANLFFASGTSGTAAYKGFINYTFSTDVMAFNVAGGNEAMRINSSGNLLVNTTNTTKTNTGFRVESGVPNTSRGSTGSFFEFYDTGSGSRIGYISNSGGVATLYNTTSDQRLKTNIVDAQSGNIDDIKVRSFDWLVNGSHQPYGMIAQELIEVAPYAVNKPENPDEMMAVDYSKLVPMMIKEIQELKQRIATLENK